MTFPDIIAIDGPAASGKTTVGERLAQALGYLMFDTGSMYRAVTLAALQRGIDVTDEAAVTTLAQQLDIKITPPHSEEEDGRLYSVFLDDDRDVTWLLRTPAVDANVSLISSYKGVRNELVRRQRGIARRGRIIMVGRDIGSVVLPDAPLKLYVTASAEERARRRWQERRAMGEEITYQAILDDVNRRDAFDSSREHSPLVPAADAIIVDTTGLEPDFIVDHILELRAGDGTAEE